MPADYVIVHVTPRSRIEDVRVDEESVRVRVRPAPEKGAANAAVIDLLADALGVKKSAVRIMSGSSGRHKLVSVDGMQASGIIERLRHAGKGE